MSLKVYEGQLLGEGIKVGIVVSRFNEFITKRLLEGALDALFRHGVSEEDVEIAWVPGSFEIPLAALKMAKSRKYDGVICLGAIIRGDTPHFNYIASECAKGIAQTMLSCEIPISFGVLTTDSIEQAIERAGTKAGNKGWEAAISLIEMVNLIKGLREDA
ncbi:MAG: 6,7-dimethyl-8-ribityllumazine synthase [Synergistetes bacterium]|nr:MAG: 6,7-dimethyl-8-ribityllumazine synthase [bacterium 42_11]MBC7331521.1 6,7-dimethyl-8-ribityllumazine synthase [Synergistota bacterium]MDK2870791.1 6,7-dimethyl-8-ribityllumazine synthase [bacterium]